LEEKEENDGKEECEAVFEYGDDLYSVIFNNKLNGKWKLVNTKTSAERVLIR